MNTPLELSEIGLQEEWSFRVLSRGGGEGRKEGKERDKMFARRRKRVKKERGKETEEGNFSTFPIDFILHSPPDPFRVSLPTLQHFLTRKRFILVVQDDS